LDTQRDTQFDEPRIVTKLADSCDLAQINAALGDETFDLIIDDGNHGLDFQRGTLRNLWGRLNAGGLYVVEDIQDFHVDDSILMVLSK
jgi:hypothetical protein